MKVSERNLRICFGASGRFLQAIWTSRANGDFFQKKLQALWPAKLFRDLGRPIFLMEFWCTVCIQNLEDGYMNKLQGWTFYVVHLLFLRKAISLPNENCVQQKRLNCRAMLLQGRDEFPLEASTIRSGKTDSTSAFRCMCVWKFQRPHPSEKHWQDFQSKDQLLVTI